MHLPMQSAVTNAAVTSAYGKSVTSIMRATKGWHWG